MKGIEFGHQSTKTRKLAWENTMEEAELMRRIVAIDPDALRRLLELAELHPDDQAKVIETQRTLDVKAQDIRPGPA